MKKRLSPKKEKYCRRRAEGESRCKAYKGAGLCPNGTDETARVNSYKMEAADTTILQRIEELRRQAEEGAILDRQARQAALSSIAIDEDQSTTDRLRAFDQLARMSGDYTDRISHTVDASVSYGDKLQAIRDAIEGK